VLEGGGLLANLAVQQRGQLFVFFFHLRYLCLKTGKFLPQLCEFLVFLLILSFERWSLHLTSLQIFLQLLVFAVQIVNDPCCFSAVPIVVLEFSCKQVLRFSQAPLQVLAIGCFRFRPLL
jgi:hypothetical protein